MKQPIETPGHGNPFRDGKKGLVAVRTRKKPQREMSRKQQSMKLELEDLDFDLHETEA